MEETMNVMSLDLGPFSTSLFGSTKKSEKIISTPEKLDLSLDEGYFSKSPSIAGSLTSFEVTPPSKTKTETSVEKRQPAKNRAGSDSSVESCESWRERAVGIYCELKRYEAELDAKHRQAEAVHGLRILDEWRRRQHERERIFRQQQELENRARIAEEKAAEAAREADAKKQRILRENERLKIADLFASKKAVKKAARPALPKPMIVGVSTSIEDEASFALKKILGIN